MAGRKSNAARIGCEATLVSAQIERVKKSTNPACGAIQRSSLAVCCRKNQLKIQKMSFLTEYMALSEYIQVSVFVAKSAYVLSVLSKTPPFYLV
jgi:hypothetical protein